MSEMVPDTRPASPRAARGRGAKPTQGRGSVRPSWQEPSEPGATSALTIPLRSKSLTTGLVVAEEAVAEEDVVTALFDRARSQRLTPTMPVATFSRLPQKSRAVAPSSAPPTVNTGPDASDLAIPIFVEMDPVSVDAPPPAKRPSHLPLTVIAALLTLVASTLTALVVGKVWTRSGQAERAEASARVTQGQLLAPSPAPTVEPTFSIASLPLLTETPAPTAQPDEDGPKRSSAPTRKWRARRVGGQVSAAPRPEATPPGYLTVACVPRCDRITASGRPLGPSPVVRAALPPGDYVLTLRAEGKTPRVVPVQILAGQTVARRIPMD